MLDGVQFRYTDDSAMAKQIASSFVKQQAFDYKVRYSLNKEDTGVDIQNLPIYW